MLNTLIKLCALIILIGVIIHGYLFIRYGAFHPCQAAQAKLTSDARNSKNLFSELQNLSGRDPIACYRFLLLGESSSRSNSNGDTDSVNRY